MVNLACPHCGAGLMISLVTTGYAYTSYDVPDAIECDGYCEAVWEPDGTARDAPKWERFPDVYDPPPA